MANGHAKFEVSSFKGSGDIDWSQNFKSRSRDPITTPMILFGFFSLGPPVSNLFAKFEVSSYNCSRDIEGVPKL